MEVILREHVEDLGQRGEVVRVSDGYARNYLIPRKLAYRMTEGVQRQVESEARAKSAREQREQETAQQLAARLEALQVVRFQRRAGESGALYGSVTSSDIADALAERGIEIDRRNVRLADPIKRVGTHHVSLHLYRETDVALAVEVEPEESAD